MYKKYRDRYLKLKYNMNGGGEKTIRTPVQIKGSVNTVPMNEINTVGGVEKDRKEIGSAGIIPYDLINGKLYYLLGFDPYFMQKQWKVFGGGVDKVDKNQRETAYREAVEEACDAKTLKKCYFDIKKIKTDLINGSGVLCVPVLNSHSKSNKWTNFYFIRINKEKWVQDNSGYDIKIPHNFILRNEVNRMRWFTEEEILDEIVGKIHEPILILFKERGEQVKRELS
jgi:hypothetical protein